MGTERPGRSIDEWLAAAVAEQASRAAARDATLRDVEATRAPALATAEEPSPTHDTHRAGAERDDYGKLVAATEASERRAIETATKTAVALGSVASWIERAQEKLSATERASTEAQARTAAVVTDAIGAIGTRLEQIERKVEAVGTSEAPHGTASAFDEVLRGFETRVQEMADRLVVRPIARRAPVAEEVDTAVAEIKAHQVQLDTGVAPRRAVESRAPDPANRVQADLLAGLRADVVRLADKLDAPRPPEGPGIDRLRQEIDVLHGSLATLATRDDLGTIERSIAALSVEVADMSVRGGNVAPMSGEVDALQAEIQRITGGGESSDHLHRITRDLDVLSHKLDIVSASGIDPNVIDALSRDVGEVRSMLSGVAMPGDLAGLSEQLVELKIELARVGSRQVDPRDFNSLRTAFDELKSMLSRSSNLGAAAEYAAVAGTGPALTRDELQPIAGMMVTLIDRLDRMEKAAADPDALDQIERQIASLSENIVDTAGRDPAMATLSAAMTGLMQEIAGWRESTAEIAERAARNAVAESLGSWNSGGDPETARRPELAPTLGTEPNQRQEVHAKLEDVVRRIGGAEQPQGLRPEPSASTDLPSEAIDRGPPPVADTRPRRLDEPMRPNLPPENDQPLDWSPKDEILLEPGAERPSSPPSPTLADAAPEAADIKASFIAAARRAAQAAAAADTGRNGSRIKPQRAQDSIASIDRDEAEGSGARLREMLRRAKRPLMVAAAALIVALGGFQLMKDMFDDRPVSTATAPTVTAPPPARIPALPAPTSPSQAPAVPPSPARDAPEPQTTQSVPDRVAASVPAPASQDRPAMAEKREPVPPIQSAPTTQKIDARDPGATELSGRPGGQASLSPPTSAVPAAQPPAKPAGPTPDSAASLSGLKLAAQGGDAVALYDLAARTADGRGVPRDPRAAVTLFEQAAEKNLAPAQYRTGNLYEKGIGVPRDVDGARKWYQRAAENGNTRAMHNLAVLMAEGAGGKPDYTSAIGWFQRAAEQGVRDSQFNLAVLYARGLGTGQDLVKSYTWFTIASVQGDEEATRKRDEVGQRLPPADLARGKAAAERWRVTASNPAANEVQIPAAWPAEGSSKRTGTNQTRG